MSDITVVIPVHPKHETYLYDAIESLQNQTFKNFSVHILSSGNMNRKTAGHPFYYSWFNEPKKQTFLRNIAIKECDTKYITFLDADDLAYPWRLEDMYKFIRSLDYDIVYSDAIKFWPNGKQAYFKARPSEEINKSVLCAFSTVMLKTSLAKQVLFKEDEDYGDDWLWMIRLLNKTKYRTFLRYPTIKIRAYSSTFYNYYENKYIKRIKGKIRMKKLMKQVEQTLKEYPCA
jgi:glycosyltransferase involved in cell wall biosynthesis